MYAIVRTHQSHNWSIQLKCDLLADSADRETPPPLVGGKSHANPMYSGLKSNWKGREENEETSTMKRPNCFHDLRTSTP